MSESFKKHFGRLIAFAVVALAVASADARAPSTEPTLTGHDAVACIGDRAWLRAEVATIGGAPLPGEIVMFTLGGVEIGRQGTDGNGRVLIPFHVPEGSHIGANAITLTMVGSKLRATANLALTKTATTIFLANTSQQVSASSDKVLLAGVVQRISDGALLPRSKA